MAANVFKLQCPSCETMVLIKDRKQIGKKIDCPKCKYRFVVEEPKAEPEPEVVDIEVVEDEAPKAAPKPGAAGKKAGAPAKAGDGKPAPAKKKPAAKVSLEDDDDEPGFKTKSKKEGAGTLVIVAGVGLAIVAIGILVVAGYYIFLSETPDTRPIARPTGLSTGPGKVEDGPVQPVGPRWADMTNLLPNDTQGVYRCNVKNLLKSMLGQAAFETAGGFHRGMVEAQLGLKLDNLDEIIVAQNFHKGWVFAAVRTDKDVDVAILKDKLGLEPAKDSPIGKLEYFVTPPSTWLDNLSRIMSEVKGEARKVAPLQSRTLAVHVLETRTLILADPEAMKAFLEVGGRPKNVAKPEGAKTGPFKPTTNYLTVSQPLKNVLDRIESKPPFLVSAAWDMAAFRPTLQPTLKTLEGLGFVNAATGTLIDSLQALGISTNMREHTTLMLSAEGQGEDTGKKIVAEFTALAQALAQSGATVDLDGRSIQPPPLPPGKTAPPAPKFVVRSTLQDKLPVITIEVQLPPPDGNRALLRNVLKPRMVLLRGMMEMAEGRQRLFDLAAVGQADLKQTKTYPRGTLERKGLNFGRPFPPDQRISWMAGLLPYLGYESVAREINPERSWRPEWDAINKQLIDDNARLGSVLVPAFLDPTSPASTWFVNMPSVPDYTYAATHYVGMAGVGLDAPTYAADDPAQAKKMGIFGYDRVTRTEDIKDGLSNTIMIIQVPPTYKRPWIAGGGATVSGVPEKKSIEPFVATKRGEKRGTYVLMADGSVRFLSADIPDDVFKAMCTINGGEKVDFEKHAAPVKPEDKGTPAALR
jgi:DNA-directed RNA polymerase subunit M/transcription elongation factor TFIIS